MTSAEIRQRFLDFFAARGHQVVPGSPLVPADDPTLLFTNAGMVQFKDAFLGKERREPPRAVSSQRCVRAGGKHNDLENVGYTGRHHTFFEMLGNFSFGDYFKREAIAYAWEFLTGELGLPAERLWVTVHDSDDEAAALWLDGIGVDPSRFARMGDEDNFWAMGDTGPCGPCSEIYYDHGPEVAGGPPGGPDGEGDRYVEIWNLVFMQFERKADGSMTPLPKPSVDTGAGLERIAAVMQGAVDNYETDLFAPLVAAAAAIAGGADPRGSSLKVVADHIRSCAFMIADGVTPSAEGRGYVLRRIIRRAARHGHRLGVGEPFLHRLVAPLDRVMGGAYPELRERRAFVERVLKAEEEQFARTLENGMAILDRAIEELGSDTLPGALVFKLYDTYGFPADLTADIARERGLKVDMEGFEREMERQRERAREGGDFSARGGLDLDPALRTAFTGYDGLRGGARVVAMFAPDGAKLDAAPEGAEALVVLDSSPFYGESGGQVGDRGTLRAAAARLEVADTQKQGEALVHRGAVRGGELRTGDRVEAEVEARSRAAVTLNHSATHLLHAALREALGPHVAQKGSLVAADRLRFDFSHPEPVAAEELRRIENQVNARVFENSPVLKEIMPLAAARERGALALFGEKYGEEVRVVSMGGEYSVEFCGGCHVDRTGDIGLFKICGETGIAAGVRRVEAVTGAAALALVEKREGVLERVGALLKAGEDELAEKARQLAAGHRALEKECERLKARMASGAGEDLAGRAVKVKGVSVLAASVEGFGPKSLREAVDRLKDRLGECVVVLASAGGDGVSLVAGVSKGLVGRVQAGELVNMVAGQVGGRGGGRPDMAMAGGGDAAAVPDALASVAPWLERKL